MHVRKAVIVGGGLAGATAAKTLRSEGYEGEIAVVCREPRPPYERPPLSKDFLAAAIADVDRPYPAPALEPAEADALGITLELGRDVVGVDPMDRLALLDDGRELGYDALLLATGSTARHLPLPGSDAAGVHTLRTRDDAEALAADLRAERERPGGRLVVVGDGWIGLEVAATARRSGLAVTVISLGEHPLERLLGPTIGQFWGRLHADHGVEFHRHAHAESITVEHGRATGLRVADGTLVEAGVVLLAVGALPGLRLPRRAGLRIDAASDGVYADRTLRTSAPTIWVAGDIASVPSRRYERPLRVEHWATAKGQGAHAARAILGSDEPYDRLPYFYTDQYDVGMEYLGHVDGPATYETVIAGSPAANEFVSFWVRPKGDGLIVEAGMTVNVRDRMDAIEELIRRATPVRRGELEGFLA